MEPLRRRGFRRVWRSADLDDFAESAQNPHTSLGNSLIQALRGSSVKAVEEVSVGVERDLR